MKRERTLLLENLTKYDQVNKFLSSKARNSQSTARTYRIGLAHFETFLHFSNSEYKDYTLASILKALLDKEIDVYYLLDSFVNYLVDRQISPSSTEYYIAAVKSYLEYWEIDILPKRFKRRVNLPKRHKKSEEPIDAKDITKILQECNNPRLRTYCMVLACCGVRSKEALGLRIRDIHFEESPIKIHIRPEFSKTRTERDIWITKETKEQIIKYLVSKYGSIEEFQKHPDDLIFFKPENENMLGVYTRLLTNFADVLNRANLDKRKDGPGFQRRKINFTSFRSYVKSIVSVQVNTDFSEWFLGHSASTYWRFKEQDKKDLYLKCVPYLTYLDYPTTQSLGADFQRQLEQRDQQIEEMQYRLDEAEFNETQNKGLIDDLSNEIKKLKAKKR